MRAYWKVAFAILGTVLMATPGVFALPADYRERWLGSGRDRGGHGAAGDEDGPLDFAIQKGEGYLTVGII